MLCVFRRLVGDGGLRNGRDRWWIEAYGGLFLRSSPYSSWSHWAPNPQEHSSSSSWSHEVNKQAKEPVVDDSPRPREIPYQVKVENLVKLIGHIKLPVKFQSFPVGKHYAATLISQNYRPIDKACWIPVLFEGDLAHVVSCHVKENDCVYVTGKLSSDPLPFDLHQNQRGLHILAEDINFVKGFDEKARDYSRKKNVKLAAVLDFADGNLDSVKKVSSEEIDDNVKHSWKERSAQGLKEGNVWRDLMKNPNQWLNYADNKSKGLVSQKHPDFKHIESGTALWLNEAPGWFLARIDNLDLGNESWKAVAWKSLAENPDQWWDNRADVTTEKSPDFKHKKTGERLWLRDSPEWFVATDIGIVEDRKAEAWKSLAENPDQWWDNRADMTTKKSPEFKHKKTGEGLWLKDSPEWFVATDIGIVEDRKEKMWKSLAENPDQWWDNRADMITKKSPDFKHKKTGEGLWLKDSPEWFVATGIGIVEDRKAEAWKSLAENPDQWWDYRANMTTKRSPDFKHKKTGEGLWLRDSPEWFVAKDIGIVENRKAEAWKSLAENPDQWWDNRANMTTNKSPDFKHKKTCEGLWLRDSPEWFVAKDIGIVEDRKAEAWKSLVENPDQWWDNRSEKKYEKSHDFKHKETGEKLWLNRSPDWVASKLPPLKQNQNVGGVLRSIAEATYCF